MTYYHAEPRCTVCSVKLVCITLYNVNDLVNAGTAELDRGLVQDLAKLGDEKEKIYAKCYNIVNAFQGIIQKKNSAGK